MTTPNLASEFVTLEEAARYLRRSRLTLEKWARDGKIPAYKTGKRYLLRLDELRHWVEECATQTKSEKPPIGQSGV